MPRIAADAGLRVAVTGAGGFIGGRLAARLAAMPAVAEIRVLGRRRGPGIVVARLDDPAQTRAALQGCHAVIHCAFDRFDMPANLAIARVLGAAAVEAGTRLVHLSTAAVYEPFLDGELDEGSAAAASGNNYKDVKIVIEEVLLAYARDRGLDLTILQPTIVYGPAGGAWTDSPVRELLTGEVVLPRRGEGLCNAVFVDDLCQAAVAALTADIPPGERFLISGAAPVAWREFLGAYEAMLGVRSLRLVTGVQPQSSAPPFPDGANAAGGLAITTLKRFVGRRLGAAGRSRLNMWLQRIRAVTRGRRVHVPDSAKHALYAARCHVRIDKARRLLGYDPQFDLARGMAATADYVQRVYCGKSRRFRQASRSG